MVRKLAFEVARATSEDADYPARDLAIQHRDCPGWRCARFASYPQEVELRLSCQCVLTELQLLAHETKIPTKCDIYVLSMPTGVSDPSRAVERRLGHIRFSDNEAEGFAIRELKTIDLDDVPALALRFVFPRCHVNKHNIYNQVGIVAVNVVGENQRGPCDAGPPLPAPQRSRDAAYAQADLELELQVDARTAARIRELFRQKQQAVDDEDYDEALRLKEAVARVRQVGAKIAQLEAQKAAAVDCEDYECAKRLKGDIDKLRAVGDAAAGASPSPPPPHSAFRRGAHPDDIFSRALGRKAPSAPMPDTAPGALVAPAVPRHLSARSTHECSGGGGGSGGGAIPAHANALDGPDAPAAHAPAYSELDAQPVGPAPDAAIERVAGPDTVPMTAAGRAATPPATHAASDCQPPDGFELVLGAGAALPPPARLSAGDANEAGALVDAQGEYVARCAHSRTWQHRQAAQRWLAERSVADDADALRPVLKYVARGLRDQVAAVVTEAAAAVKRGLAQGGRVAGAVAAAALPALVERLGDNNARVADTARAAIEHMAVTAPAEFAAHRAPLVATPKRAGAWKVLLARLECLERVLATAEVGRERAPERAFTTAEVMALAAPALGHANASVRAAAVRLVALCHRDVGSAATQLLPSDINAKVREAISEAVGQPLASITNTGPASPPAAPRAAAAPAPRKAAPPRRGRAEAPAAKKAPPAATAERASPPPRASPRRASPRRAPPPASSPTAADSDADLDAGDVASLEADLAAKEAALGPHHPDVADCLSNLAIVHNQAGRAAAAQPLYERALAIFERAEGPHSQEVAHTLTDLAVLHLEARRDAVGRPLLERALAIQRVNLGDGHPDVVAILDVLHGE